MDDGQRGQGAHERCEEAPLALQKEINTGNRPDCMKESDVTENSII